MKTKHKELIWTFKEVLSVEAYTRQKIITAVDTKYINALSYHNTTSTKKTIYVILKHLFDTHGKIITQMLTQQDDLVKKMTFDVDTPIDTVFNDVEELGDIATTYINSYTDHHYINLAYNIINKTGKYKIGLQEWNRKDTSDKKWAELKPHFCTAHQELNNVAGKLWWM